MWVKSLACISVCRIGAINELSGLTHVLKVKHKGINVQGRDLNEGGEEASETN